MASERLELAVELHRSGHMAEAEARYLDLVGADPDDPDARYYLAVLYSQTGRPALGIEPIRRAAELEPDSPTHRFILGRLFQDCGRLNEAVEAFGQALELNPTAPDVLFARALAWQAMNRLDRAEADYRQVMALDPRHSGAPFNLGNLFSAHEHFESAVDCFSKAIAAEPGFAQAHNNLGGALYKLNRLEPALAAYRRAAEISPAANIFHNIAIILQDQGRLAEAIASYRRALDLKPDFAEAFSGLLFCLCFDDSSDPDEVFSEHLRYDETQIRPRMNPVQGHPNSRDPERRLRIGYVSPDFRLHPCGHFVLPVIERHDKSQFEVFCYYNSLVEDPYTGMFRDAADHWHVCAGEDDRSLADRIMADGIDILVECAGHMGGSRLPMFGLRPAPVQVGHPLYPNTTGVSTIDYRIMDSFFAPPWADAWHSEKLVRMPQVHVTYRPHRDDILPALQAPCLTSGFVTFGCFNNFAKVGDQTVEAWARILEQVPGSKLVLKWKGLGDDEAERYARSRFVARGIGAERIILAGWSPDPYSPYQAIDIALDLFFANGGTTTCDALWMGVPIVTCHGRTPFSRVGLCHLTNVGLPELITADAEAYVAKAVELATDRTLLVRLRDDLRGRFMASPLMDSDRYTRTLEESFRIMWRRWCAGEPPSPISW